VKRKFVLPALISEPPIKTAVSRLMPSTHVPLSDFKSFNKIANTPISGTFSNMPDGSTITVGNNTYLVSYEGGTGNDLTLTVQ
jgi:hypothetical protein